MAERLIRSLPLLTLLDAILLRQQIGHAKGQRCRPLVAAIIQLVQQSHVGSTNRLIGNLRSEGSVLSEKNVLRRSLSFTVRRTIASVITGFKRRTFTRIVYASPML